MKYAVMDSPIGPLTLLGGEGGLQAIFFGHRVLSGAVEDLAFHQAAMDQLGEYFRGRRRQFRLPIQPRGTAFQLKVWHELLEIPYGETRSYGEIARRIGKPGAPRAIGMANHQNPIPVIIPCHRVIGHDRSLTGYGGGLDIKAQLLELEGASFQDQAATGASARGRSTARTTAR